MSMIKFSAQATTEYLMTYGATSLAVVVVLIILMQLGVFNLSTQIPTTQMGSCRLARQNVLDSIQVSLLGVCKGRPLQVFTQFNGQSSKIAIPSTPLLGTGSF